MLAARDQENRLFGHRLGGAGAKQLQGLQPKTPGAQYPKTPMKIPLNDAKGKGVMGGRENIQTVGKAGKSNFMTPMEPRTSRAPLGNKTTNAKAQAQALQQQQKQQLPKTQAGVKDIVRELERSQQQQPNTVRRPRVSPQGGAFKLSVLSDDKVDSKPTSRGNGDDDIEHAAPRDPVQRYESDVFPDGVLTFAAFQPQNRLRGYYDHYYNPVGADGVRQLDKEIAEKQRRAFEKLDIQVQEDVEAFDWSIGDEPTSKTLVGSALQSQKTTAAPPPTVMARKASSALALPARATALSSSASSSVLQQRRKPAKTLATQAKTSSRLPATSETPFLPGLPIRKTRAGETGGPLRPKDVIANGRRSPIVESVSRSTLGYNKGRSALSLVRGKEESSQPVKASSTTTPTAASGPGQRARRFVLSSTPAATVTLAAQTPERKMNESSTSNTDDGSMGGSQNEEAKTPSFLAIFEAESEDAGLGTMTPLFSDEEDEFQLDIKF